MSTLWRFIADPIRGVTPLWKVAVFYSIAGGGIFSVAMQIAAFADPAAVRLIGFLGLAFSAYVTVAVFRCAGNSRVPQLAPIIRIAAALSLIMLPFMAYFIVTGRVTFAT
jgi:hypothetical protein